MGYGLAGAIGAALACPGRRTFLIEGDGGFTPEPAGARDRRGQRPATLKIFIFEQRGLRLDPHDPARTTSAATYLGCDTQTGLGFPDWATPVRGVRHPVHRSSVRAGTTSSTVRAALDDPTGRTAFIVRVDPEQTYFPKITSRVTATGAMESQPLHLMSPDLAPEIAAQVFRFI